VWDAQFADPELAHFRLLAPDLRGHGSSEAPQDGYDDPAVWADDLAAVLDLAGGDAVVVGWSYGGLVITDYLRVHGTRGLAGLVFVGAITEIGRNRPGGRVGPAMAGALPAALSDDLDVALPALRALGEGMAARDVPGEVSQALLGTSLAVPPRVRSALFRRDVGSEDVLSAIDVPTLVVHGTEDAVVNVTAGEYTAGKIAGASTRWWSGVGHLPFVESAREFDTTLRGFAERAFSDVKAPSVEQER
jgi:non-heme chloroperoxidase